MEAAPRYHPLAWTSAVALGAAGWAGHFDYQDLAGALATVFALALIAWIATKWVARLKRRLPDGGSLALAAQRWLASFALVAFGLYAILLHALGLVFVYAEPTKNRAYAESMGFEFGPYILLSFAISVVAGILVFAAIRSLRATDAARSASLWLCCVLAPIAWLAIAIATASLVEGLKEQWTALGADLPAPTLFMIGFVEYRMIPAVVALCLLGLAWFWRSRAGLFRWVAFGQVLVLLLGSAFFAFAIYSFAANLFSMCGGAI